MPYDSAWTSEIAIRVTGNRVDFIFGQGKEMLFEIGGLRAVGQDPVPLKHAGGIKRQQIEE